MQLQDDSPDFSQPTSATGRRSGTRKTVFVVGAILVAVLAGVLLLRAFGVWQPDDPGKEKSQYTCPMHPEIIRDAPGSCPICGMDLVPMEKHEEHSEGATQSTQYTCPMHPEIIRDAPGSCPICGMDLVPMVKQERGAMESSVPGRATLSIDSEQRRRLGLRLGVVENRNLTRDVRTSAKIVVDETRQARVTTKIDGWVDKLYVATTGQTVKKGEPLLTIYSPELVSAQEEYLSALATQAQLAASSEEARQGGDRLVAAARRRLELWDISDEQVRRLEESQRVEKYLTLYAPVSGWVIERTVLPGQKVMAGEPMLVIADLTKVWAEADIYQSDLPHVRVGMPVQITLPALPGKTIQGRVSFVTPTLDAETRTMRARLEIDNRELLLKPEMYATAHLEHEIGPRLAIPTSAVIFTGTQTLAFRQGEGQQLVAAEIKLGGRSGDYYELLSGLNEGDSVVTSANFLIDSESSLEAARAALTGKNAEPAPSGHEGH
jgi:RND family efflux transporter MFP subunit